MNRTHQMKTYRFTDGLHVIAPRYGFEYDIPWMAPHASGRLLDSVIDTYQLGQGFDAAHKVTLSRNKREGRYVGHAGNVAFRAGEGRHIDCGFAPVCKDHVCLLIGARLAHQRGNSRRKAVRSLRGRL